MPWSQLVGMRGAEPDHRHRHAALTRGETVLQLPHLVFQRLNSDQVVRVLILASLAAAALDALGTGGFYCVASLLKVRGSKSKCAMERAARTCKGIGHASATGNLEKDNDRERTSFLRRHCRQASPRGSATLSFADSDIEPPPPLLLLEPEPWLGAPLLE